MAQLMRRAVYSAPLSAAAIEQHYQTAQSVALTLVRQGGQVVLTWPVAASGFVLQSSSSLGGTNWVNSILPVEVVNTSNVVAVPNSGATQFFRFEQAMMDCRCMEKLRLDRAGQWHDREDGRSKCL